MSRASRAVLKGKVQTVTGLIDPADVGPTLMHEHLFLDLNPPRFAAEAVEASADDEVTRCNCFKVRYGQQPSRLNYRLNERAIAVAGVAEVRAADGRTIVELTSGGLRPDPGGLVEVARATGVNIVMGCGHYVHEYHDPANADAADDFAHEMITQVLQGAWGSMCAPAYRRNRMPGAVDRAGAARDAVR